MAQDSIWNRDLYGMLGRAISQSSLNVGYYDINMRHLHINSALCEALGLASEAEGLGRRLSELYPQVGFEEFEAFAHARRIQTPQNRYPGPDGR